MAQIARALRLASAIATNIRGFLPSIRASQEPSGIDRHPSQFRRDMAPMIRRRRMSAWPDFDTRPSRSFPPDECWGGTSPSHAEKSRPRRKVAMSGAKDSTASAVSGPTPGIVCKRRAASLFSTMIFAVFVRLSKAHAPNG
jgi:hypothetical protein